MPFSGTLVNRQNDRMIFKNPTSKRGAHAQWCARYDACVPFCRHIHFHRATCHYNWLSWLLFFVRIGSPLPPPTTRLGFVCRWARGSGARASLVDAPRIGRAVGPAGWRMYSLSRLFPPLFHLASRKRSTVWQRLASKPRWILREPNSIDRQAATRAAASDRRPRGRQQT